ncbi:MAG: M23 family metallopeptidase [Elusimicrobia bacterium]|nr:M23 family metallopeptidase [Elusimicrobiota bacterium]
MSIVRKLFSRWDQTITVLVVPQTAAFKPRQFRFSLAFAVFVASVWAGVTAWAVALAGRHVDYAITKVDNRVMAAKMAYLSDEMDKSREMLDLVKRTDRSLRTLLGMSGREEIVRAGESLGGPTAEDRLSLNGVLAAVSSRMDQALWHRNIAAIREESAQRLASFQEISWYVGNQRSVYRATPGIRPCAGQITSRFGYRLSPFHDDFAEFGEYHQGLDIAGSPDTIITATADGTVRYAGWAPGYGRMVVIDHGNGVSTLYAHASKTIVKTGDRVWRGAAIAYMGTTGRATGPHLHYEVWARGRPVDPMGYLKEGPVGGAFLAAASRACAAGAGAAGR